MNATLRFLTAFALAAAPALVSAQPAANASGARQVLSPEIAADNKVTFRLYAPNVKAVTLTGDFIPNNTRLAKDEAGGVWSFTTAAALPPGVMGYYFTIDGVRSIDPGNLNSFGGGRFLKSYFEVKGDGHQFWSQRAVPHGMLHEVFYEHPTLGSRRVLVYTPPGYDAAASKTYPAVYLYSGSGDNETYWSRIGRAHFIMDNLIAEGKAQPALVVMPYGSATLPAPGDGQEDTADGVYGVKAIERDLLGSVIPTVEKHFKVGREPKDRAIFGFSMGGYFAPTIGLNHPEIFGWVCGASTAGFRGEGVPAKNFQGLEAQLALAKQNFKFVGFTVGTGSDAGGTAGNKSAVDYLTGLGLQVEWSQPTGGMHAWHSWRGYFRDLMADKFFVAQPYTTPKVGSRDPVPGITAK
jgi:enterochelin esterase-like enzyme